MFWIFSGIDRYFSCYFRAFLLLFLAMISTTQTHAKIFELHNETLEDDNTYADHLIAQYKAAGHADWDANIVYVFPHLGDHTPLHLQRIMARLNRAHIHARAELKSVEEFDALVSEAEKTASTVHKITYGPLFRSKLKDIAAEMMGLQKGTPLVFKLDLRKGPLIENLFWTALAGGIAGAANYVSLWIEQSNGAQVDIPMGVIAAIVWSGVNNFFVEWARNIHMHGRGLVEYAPGKFRIDTGQTNFYATSAVRSFLTSMINAYSSFGGVRAWTALTINMALNLTARGHIDQKIASLRNDFGKYVAAVTIWGFIYTTIKTLPLLDAQSGTDLHFALRAAMHAPYVALATIGAYQLYDRNQFAMERLLLRIANHSFFKQSGLCTTLLTLPSVEKPLLIDATNSNARGDALVHVDHNQQ